MGREHLVSTSVNIPAELHARAKRIFDVVGITMSEVIVGRLRGYVEETEAALGDDLKAVVDMEAEVALRRKKISERLASAGGVSDGQSQT